MSAGGYKTNREKYNEDKVIVDRGNQPTDAPKKRQIIETTSKRGKAKVRTSKPERRTRGKTKSD